MSYQHDIFISYRRELLWTPWTRDYLKRELQSYLQQDIGRSPDIFVDERIEIGEDWVDQLGEHLARSKLVVALLSRDYFRSVWCLHELDLMLERTGGQVGLFTPVIVHDCETLPDPISRAQQADFKQFRLTRMNRDGQTFEDFTRAVKQLSADIARRLNAVPNFDPAWVGTCTRRFNDAFRANLGGSPFMPVHFTPPDDPPHPQPPRLAP